jgi:TolB-like protein
MTPERWQQISQIYDAACVRPLGERAAFVAGVCGHDAGLRREVEALLDQPTSPPALEKLTPAAVARAIGDEAPATMTGRRFGPYVVHERIGAGGMGEVYRARDDRLARDVAIKVLPGALAADPERSARFQREARVLASLDHPHIGAIYGVEESEGVCALVLGLIDGETLAERIARGPLPVADALDYARQIAGALEAAHDKGVIHRDLKPANIKITRAGVVKVLDFGLAKTEQLADDRAALPTQTRTGVVMGTPAYMSPEQARGYAVDKRTDIWAFGCVLYAMLTGRDAFAGATPSDTLAAILEREPDCGALPAATPARIAQLLARCFDKDPQRRLRDVGEARVAIEEAQRAGAVGRWTPSFLAGVVVLVVIAAVIVAGLAWRQRADAVPAAAATPSDRRIAIAVLPFADISPARDQAHLADGMSEELIASMGRIPDLQVTGRESSFRFRGRNEELKTIRDALGVDYLLTGSIQRTELQLRVTLQLLDATTGFQIWSDSYDRALEDIFAIQDEISSSVAEQLGVRLGLGPNRFPGMTRNVAAYEQLLRGRLLFDRLTAESLQAAVAHFERAFAIDPSFSSALVWQSFSYYQLSQFTIEPDGATEWRRRAAATLEQARALTPEAPDVLDELARAEMNRGNWLSAARLLERLAAVRGGDVRARTLESELTAAHMTVASGRTQEAIDAFTRARVVEPLSPYVALFLGQAYSIAGRHSDALTELDRGLTLGGGEPLLRGNAILAALGSEPTSRQEIERRVAPTTVPGPFSMLNVTMARFLGDPAAARSEVRRLANTPAGQAFAGRSMLASWAAYYGDAALALEYLSEVAQGNPDFAVLWRPVMREVRRLPGFKDLVRRIGLVEYWGAYGWPDPDLCRRAADDDFTCG